MAVVGALIGQRYQHRGRACGGRGGENFSQTRNRRGSAVHPELAQGANQAPMPGEVAPGSTVAHVSHQRLLVLQFKMEGQARATADQFTLNAGWIVAEVLRQHCLVGDKESSLTAATVDRPADGSAVDRA
jgi:hypothetical protein